MALRICLLLPLVFSLVACSDSSGRSAGSAFSGGSETALLTSYTTVAAELSPEDRQALDDALAVLALRAGRTGPDLHLMTQSGATSARSLGGTIDGLTAAEVIELAQTVRVSQWEKEYQALDEQMNEAEARYELARAAVKSVDVNLPSHLELANLQIEVQNRRAFNRLLTGQMQWNGPAPLSSVLINVTVQSETTTLGPAPIRLILSPPLESGDARNFSGTLPQQWRFRLTRMPDPEITSQVRSLELVGAGAAYDLDTLHRARETLQTAERELDRASRAVTRAEMHHPDSSPQ